MFFIDSIFYELSVYFSVISESFTVGGHNIFTHINIMTMQEIIKISTEMAESIGR